ncbi:MAG TPA: alcohol dehydrogenase catalytic domain-containing protein, partial [Sedimentisphaerales bacterium]|nr:alcohol dehydrogenase catalytic domain-containing protein [Sedimentisphaerales bacterium]
MKALIHTKPCCFEYCDFPDPTAGDDDVLIRVKACGICGSDVHGCTGKTGRRIPPLIMGHEAAGIVEQVGRNVKGLKKGDRVCFDSTVYCNTCQACRKGLYNRCDKRQVLGVSVPAFKRHGAFAEYVAVPSWIVFKLPDQMSFVQAALLEPASIGTHASNRAPISADDTVLVIGAGTIGLFILQGARLRGAARVIAVDIDEFRLDVAKKLGADAIINPANSDLKDTVLELTEGQGVNVAI